MLTDECSDCKRDPQSGKADVRVPRIDPADRDLGSDHTCGECGRRWRVVAGKMEKLGNSWEEITSEEGSEEHK